MICLRDIRFLCSLIGVDLNQPDILATLKVSLSSTDAAIVPFRKAFPKGKHIPKHQHIEKLKNKQINDNRMILAELHCRKENEAHLGG